jgi:hypothetical protein
VARRERLTQMDRPHNEGNAAEFYNILWNYRGFVDHHLTDAQRATLPPDVLSCTIVTGDSIALYITWLNANGAPPGQFPKYINALEWAARVRALRCACVRAVVCTRLTPAAVHARRGRPETRDVPAVGAHQGADESG